MMTEKDRRAYLWIVVLVAIAAAATGVGASLFFLDPPRPRIVYSTDVVKMPSPSPTLEEDLGAVSFGIGPIGPGIPPTPQPTPTPLVSADDLDYVSFNLTTTTPVSTAEGFVYWNNDEHTININTNVSGTVMQAGREMYTLVVNNTGDVITDGYAVYISGAQGNRPTAALASAGTYTTTQAIGLATQDIADNAQGYVTTYGDVRGIDTRAFTEGAQLWLANDGGGVITSTAPLTGCKVLLGTALNSTVNGTISVNPSWRCDNFGDIVAGNYADFEYNGFLQNYGDARAYIDYNFGTGALGAGVSAPDLVQLASTGIFLRGFDGLVTSEQLFFSVEMNHDWAVGTIVYPHVHWMPTTVNTGTIVWYLTYAITDMNGDFSSASTISVTKAITTASQWHSFYTDFPEIDMSAYDVMSQFSARFYRVPTGVDTYPDDAVVQTVGLHVLVDTLGSREEESK